ncbi:hypothetical protein [Salisaeta icosahedral phage 1]|uniref:DNA primase n=1 Tax=Salisaeta icosahedral phage 1 TaxID=1183239 RepID=UPI00025EA933|nr:DNA primase [Salisaeta icosahedral phage 1]AFJ21493.1 hypothetical protein [Salisaeta icosahedral phage 1]
MTEQQAQVHDYLDALNDLLRASNDEALRRDLAAEMQRARKALRSGMLSRNLMPRRRHHRTWDVLGPSAKREADYVYQRADGRTAYIVRRVVLDDRSHPAHGEKGFAVLIDNVWKEAEDITEPLPYRLPEVQATKARGEPVFFVEGEKDVEALRAHGITATCNPGGVLENLDIGRHMKGARVAIWPDRDVAGWMHAKAIARHLAPHAASVRIIQPPAAVPLKGDVSDWIQQGATRKQIIDHVQSQL